MDARLDPAKYAGLSEGDAHVIQNAGGARPHDAIRSLVIISQATGKGCDWFVIHHTNCGMELFTDDVIGDLLTDSLETAKFDGKAWSYSKHGHGASAGLFVKWHTIKDQASSVAQDVRRIREHPLVAKHIPIYGYIYDVHSGHLVEVTDATEAGRTTRDLNSSVLQSSLLGVSSARTGISALDRAMSVSEGLASAWLY